MCRKSIRPVIQAFHAQKSLKRGNTHTENGKLYLFGNLIAEYRSNRLWIRDAGWQTVTTKDRLNGLNGVSISQRKYQWYLNGNPWNGSWIKVGKLTVKDYIELCDSSKA
jgi:hypothetical protein